MAWEIAGDRDARNFATLAEAEAATRSDVEKAWRREKEMLRRQREFEARRGEALAKERWDDQRSRIESVLDEARSGPGQAEASLRQAIAEGRVEDALLAALRLTALPAVLEAAEAVLAGHMAARASFSDPERGKR